MRQATAGTWSCGARRTSWSARIRPASSSWSARRPFGRRTRGRGRRCCAWLRMLPVRPHSAPVTLGTTPCAHTTCLDSERKPASILRAGGRHRPHGAQGTSALPRQVAGLLGLPAETRKVCCCARTARMRLPCCGAAVTLYLRLRAGLRPGDALVDLYCGSGAMALGLARECERAGFQLGSVTGVEADASAVRDGRANAQRNGIRNATCAMSHVVAQGTLL